MKFGENVQIIVDECIAESTKELLRRFGYEVFEIDDILYYSVDDEKIFAFASTNNLAIITHDRRFGRIYLESIDNPTTTFVLAVVAPQPKGSNQLLQFVLEKYSLDNPKFQSKLVIIGKNKIRIKSKY